MGKAIVVSSGKGGTGKTNATINIGVALAELGKSVALIDGSLTTPDIALQLGIPLHVHGLTDILKKNSHIQAATFNHSSGLRIIPGNIHINLLKEFEGRKFKKLLKKLKKEHDFVLVDCAAGLGREAISAIKNCDQMLIVTNPELTSIVNASKTIQVAKDLKVKPVGVVLNRTNRLRNELKEKQIKPLLHEVPILGKIPENKKIVKSIKKAESIVNRYPRCKISKEFRKIAHHLGNKKEKQENLFSKFIGFFKKRINITVSPLN